MGTDVNVLAYCLLIKTFLHLQTISGNYRGIVAHFHPRVQNGNIEVVSDSSFPPIRLPDQSFINALTSNQLEHREVCERIFRYSMVAFYQQY
jgi:hypothetical protein